MRYNTFCKLLVLSTLVGLVVFVGCAGDSGTRSVPCLISVTAFDDCYVRIAGDDMTLNWTTVGDRNENVRIELWKDSSLVCTVQDDVRNSGSYNWIVDECDQGGGSGYTIRVVEKTSGHFGESDPFTIEPLTCIIINRPGAVDLWIVGETHRIQWLWHCSCVDTVRVELWKSGRFVCTIDSSDCGNSESHQWAVDDCDQGIGSDYRIRIIDVGSGVYGESRDFAIGLAPCSFIVTAPDTGAIWPMWAERTITWTTTGDFYPDVSLELWREGMYVGTIASNVPNSGSHTWIVKPHPAYGPGE